MNWKVFFVVNNQSAWKKACKYKFKSFFFLIRSLLLHEFFSLDFLFVKRYMVYNKTLLDFLKFLYMYKVKIFLNKEINALNDFT